MARARYFRIKNYQHTGRKRKARFRCMVCDKLIPDGDDPIVERRGRTSRAIHAACWETNDDTVKGVKARAEQVRVPGHHY